MKTVGNYKHLVPQCVGFALVQALLAAAAYGAAVQLISAPDPKSAPSVGGAGDSYLPVLSRDGRYVLFGSTADNLVVPATNRPTPALLPAPINVFLRDRTNGLTTLISVSSDGIGGGNGDSLPIGISTNGRYALFESRASNLVPGDMNNAADVFIRDLEGGTTLLVSASTNGGLADGASYSSVMTPDGRYVAFTSTADNLVPGDDNGIPDVFVRDMGNNVTRLVSVGAQRGPFVSYDQGTISDTPVITPDGRYIAFYSTATNLAPGVETTANVYVSDQKLGTIIRASAGALPVLQSMSNVTNASSFNHALSDDGRFIVFETVGYSYFTPPNPLPALILRYDTQTDHTDLVETNAVLPLDWYDNVQNLSITPDARFVTYVANGVDISGTNRAIRLWDAQSGISTLVSGNTNGFVSAGSISDSPVIDRDGRFIVFVSSASDLVTNTSPADFHVYLRDLQTQSTTLVDADTNGAGSLIDPSTAPSISADAHVIAFHRQEGSAGPLNRKHTYDVLARDLGNAAVELVSAHDPSLPSVTANGTSVASASSISFDARFISFWSDADDLVANDTNGLRDVFVRDLLNGTTALVSMNTNGVSGDGYSTDCAISADGRYVAFTSFADDLVDGDTNRALDVFVRDLQSSTTTLVSVNMGGTGPGSGPSYSPLLSSNGQVVVFHSLAKDLTPGMGSQLDVENLFWRDLKNNRTYALTTNQTSDQVIAVSITPDARAVSLVKANKINNPLSPPSQLYLWDAGSSSIVYSLTGGTDSFGPLSISPNGQTLVYVTNAADSKQLVALDRVANTNWVIASYQGLSTASPRFSANSRFLAYVASPGPLGYSNQVYLYDFQTGTNLLASRGYDGVSPGNNDSDSLDVSFDGRFVAYRSAASNLVPGTTNMLPNIFLFDTANGQTTLVTASRFGGSISDNRSLPAPVFSRDGHTVLFGSWADDLIPNDFNHNADVFVLGLSGTAVIPLTLSVFSDTNSGPATWLSWPVMPGKSYRLQFKQNLEDATWQDLTGQISTIGNRNYVKDTDPVTTLRFYRIVAF